MKYRVEIEVVNVGRLGAIRYEPGERFSVQPGDKVVIATYRRGLPINSNDRPTIGELISLTDDYHGVHWFRVTDVVHCDRGDYPMIRIRILGSIDQLTVSECNNWERRVRDNLPKTFPKHSEFELHNTSFTHSNRVIEAVRLVGSYELKES